MDIAGMSVINARQNIQMAASMSMLKKSMESDEANANQLLEMLPKVAPSTSKIDVRA